MLHNTPSGAAPPPAALPVPPDRLPRPKGVSKRVCPDSSPFHTQRGFEAQQWAIQNLPEGLLPEIIITYRERAPEFQFGHAEHWNAAKHTVACAATAVALARAGYFVVDTHSAHDSGEPTGRSMKTARGSKWQLRASDIWQEALNFYLGIGNYPLSKDGFEHRFAHPQRPRGVGLRTGGSYIVLDEDGEDGRASLRDILERTGGTIPVTPTQRTGRLDGGRQFLLGIPPECDVRNSAGLLGKGLDIRGKGGFAMVGPSLHPSGIFYHWLPGLAPGQAELAMAPDWLLDILLRASKATTGGSGVKPPRAERAAGTPGVSNSVGGLPAGFEAKLNAIGDAPDRHGFDRPIYAACLAWFARSGVEGDTDELYELLRVAIKAAPKKPGRDPDRYFHNDDEELRRQIERARDFAIENFDGDEDDLPEPALEPVLAAPDLAATPGTTAPAVAAAPDHALEVQRAARALSLPRRPSTKSGWIKTKASARARLDQALDDLGLSFPNPPKAPRADINDAITEALKGPTGENE